RKSLRVQPLFAFVKEATTVAQYWCTPGPAAGLDFVRDGAGSMSNLLIQVIEQLNRGSLQVIDLTQPLSPDTPILPLPPQFQNTPRFRIWELSHYDDRGPAWYWNAFETGEHTGTHFDAPVHWVSGKDLPDSTVDRIAPKKFIGPACVIDVTKDVERNSDFLLTSGHIRQWEAGHGRI